MRGIFSWLKKRTRYSMEEANPWEPLATHVAASVHNDVQYMIVMQAVRAHINKTRATEPTNDVMAFAEMMIRDVRGYTLH